MARLKALSEEEFYQEALKEMGEQKGICFILKCGCQMVACKDKTPIWFWTCGRIHSWTDVVSSPSIIERTGNVALVT